MHPSKDGKPISFIAERKYASAISISRLKPSVEPSSIRETWEDFEMQSKISESEGIVWAVEKVIIKDPKQEQEKENERIDTEVFREVFEVGMFVHELELEILRRQEKVVVVPITGKFEDEMVEMANGLVRKAGRKVSGKKMAGKKNCEEACNGTCETKQDWDW